MGADQKILAIESPAYDPKFTGEYQYRIAQDGYWHLQYPQSEYEHTQKHDRDKLEQQLSCTNSRTKLRETSLGNKATQEPEKSDQCTGETQTRETGITTI